MRLRQWATLLVAAPTALFAAGCGRTSLDTGPLCGDGIRQPPEACDGADLPAPTCAELFGPAATGRPTCTPTCTLDTSTCDIPPLCATSAGLQPGAPWPIAGGCPQHLGRTAFEARRPTRVRWRREAQFRYFLGQELGVVDSNGVIFVNAAIEGIADLTGLVAIAPDDSDPVWIADQALAVAIGAADGGRLYVNARELDALHLVGAVVWEASPFGGYGADGPLVAADGTIYLLGLAQFPPATLQAFTPAGAVTIQRDTPIEGSLSLAPDGSLVGSRRGGISKLDEHGTPLWSTHEDSNYGFTFVGDDGTIFFLAYRTPGETMSLKALSADGTDLWTQDLGTDCILLDAAVDPRGTIYVPTCSKSLRAIAADGTIAWDRRFYSVVPAPVLDAGNHLIVAADGKLTAIDLGGYVVWEFEDPSLGFQGRPIVLPDGALLVLANPDEFGGAATLAVVEP